MKLFGKPLGVLLAGLVLASCGGGGGNGGSVSPPQSGSITLSATTTTLPTNAGSWFPHDHGPNQAEITVTMRNADGTLMVGRDVSISISPVEVAALSFLVSDDNDNFDNLWGTFTIKGTNGVATAWVNAASKAGTATVTASTTDPTTSRSISATLQFKVTSGVGPAPATVSLSPSTTAVYLPSSGGNNNSIVNATVKDGGGQLIADPATGNNGYDNIKFELVGDTGDAVLSSNSVAGPASGKSVTSHTVHGVATTSFQAGSSTPQGPVQIRATVDRADNNVSNGIQDPVTATTSVIVSDGKLYSLELTSPLFAPNLPGITINSVSGQVDAGSAQDSPIPPDPDATLSLTITALAKDRQGNPPLPGTPIRFGLVDAPVGAPGTPDDNRFLLSGMDGNPKEGGNLFTAPTGRFTTAGVNGANAGDALLVFGRAVEGNADLESALTVTSVNSATSLNVAPAFNNNYRNDAPIDTGSVLPYLIGRAMHGNITGTGTTDDKGVVHAKLNYTVNTVGSSMAVWAQGDGIDRVNNGPRRVSAVGTMVYPGVAPATISASPDPIRGDTTDFVTVCVADALGIPLRGMQVSFKFELAAGTGSVDGKNGSGTFGDLTDTTGCSTGKVVTSGVPATPSAGPNSKLTLNAAGQTTSVGIAVQIATLQVSPNTVSVPSAGRSAAITVTTRTADGTLVPGAVITGTCTASGGDGATINLSPGTATTGANGAASFTAQASKFVKAGTPPSTGTGQCVFSTDGVGSGTVTFNGVATCDDLSPPDPSCNL